MLVLNCMLLVFPFVCRAVVLITAFYLLVDGFLRGWLWWPACMLTAHDANSFDSSKGCWAILKNDVYGKQQCKPQDGKFLILQSLLHFDSSFDVWSFDDFGVVKWPLILLFNQVELMYKWPLILLLVCIERCVLFILFWHVQVLGRNSSVGQQCKPVVDWKMSICMLYFVFCCSVQHLLEKNDLGVVGQIQWYVLKNFVIYYLC